MFNFSEVTVFKFIMGERNKAVWPFLASPIEEILYLSLFFYLFFFLFSYVRTFIYLLCAVFNWLNFTWLRPGLESTPPRYFLFVCYPALTKICYLVPVAFTCNFALNASGYSFVLRYWNEDAIGLGSLVFYLLFFYLVAVRFVA